VAYGITSDKHCFHTPASSTLHVDITETSQDYGGINGLKRFLNQLKVAQHVHNISSSIYGMKESTKQLISTEPVRSKAKEILHRNQLVICELVQCFPLLIK